MTDFSKALQMQQSQATDANCI